MRALLPWAVLLAAMAAFLLPMVRDSQRQSELLGCYSNLRELSFGLHRYADDYDQRLPNLRSWADQIAPYVNSPSSYHCPATELRHVLGDPDQPGAFRLHNACGLWTGGPPPTLDRVANRGDWLLLCEADASAPFVPRHGGLANCAFADGRVREHARMNSSMAAFDAAVVVGR